MKLKPTGKRFVDDSPSDRFGVYCWEMPNGAYIMDEQRNVLNIASERGDLKRIAKLKAAAESYVGKNDGHAVFFAGHRQVTEEEYQEQRERMRSGLVPDSEDIGSILEDMRNQRVRGN